MQSLCLAWGVWIGFVCLVGSARAEGGAPDAEMRKLIEQLADQLQEKASGRRRSAVRKLAKLDDADGWGLVLSALDDPKGEVADEAQLAIAQIEGERQVKELLGRDGLRSKQEWVRVRVAEALGRMEVTLPMREVGRALDPRDVESCSALLWSVERLADAGHVKDDADKLVREVDDCLSKRVDARVRAAGVSALVALACAASVGDLEGVVREDLVRDFMRLAGDKSSEVRCAWVAGLARLGGDANCSKMIACLADRAANVRLQAVESLLSVADRRVLEALSDRLERESNDRVISRIVTGLRAVTGMKYRADPRSWKRWLEGVSE
ncbi:MAG: HEAT repeat protein, partial [Planctomycetota bacterium]